MSKKNRKSRKNQKSKVNVSEKQKNKPTQETGKQTHLTLSLNSNKQEQNSALENKNQESIKKDSWSYLLLSLIATGITVGLFALAVLFPKGVSKISVLLATLSVIALISAKTPIGVLINKISWLHPNQIDQFFAFYKRGLVLIAKNTFFIVIFLTLIYLNTLFLMNVLVGSVITGLMLVIFYTIFRDKIQQSLFRLFLQTSFSIMIITSGVIFVSTEAFEQKTLDNSFFEVKKEPLIVDNLLNKASNATDYRQLLELTYKLDLRAKRLKFLSDDKNIKPNLWESPNWANNFASYVITSETIRLVKDYGIPITNFDSAKGKSFKGANNFLNNIRQLTQSEFSTEFEQKLLKSSLSDSFYWSENEFRETWYEVTKVFSNDQVNLVKQGIEADFNSKPVWSLSPLYLKPRYLSTYVLEPYLYNITCLTVIAGILYNRIGSTVLNNYYPILLILGLILFLIFSNFLAKRIEKYNQNHDPQSNNPSWRFFAITALFGLIVAYYTY